MGISNIEYKKAIKALEEGFEFAKTRSNDVEFKIARDACIQRFKFCIEIAWKLSAKHMGSRATTAKPVIREMAQIGLINSPNQWFEFVDARNRTSHSYNEDIAKEVYEIALKFLPLGKELLELLK